jgi:hypothetical protein
LLVVGAWAPLLFSAACQAFVGDYTLDLDVEQPIEPAALCELERELFTFEIDLDSAAALEDLESYYERENTELVAHLRDLALGLENGESRRGVTYLMGAAGVGKSFVTRNAFDAFPEAARCSAILTDLLGVGSAQLGFETGSAPDLATVDGEVVFNELPAAVNPDRVELEELLLAAGCFQDGELRPLVVIDGIDEVQDDTSKAILSAVDRYLLEGEGNELSYLEIIVAGRPGGFASWLTDPKRNERNRELVTSFDLVPPRYVTAGDLEFRALGYLDFSGELEDHTEVEVQGRVASFQQAVADTPFLTYSLGNLAVGNAVVDLTAPGLEHTEYELKAGLLDSILLRNAQSHGRPGAGSAHDVAYGRLLEDIAARYADVADDGTFSVASSDAIELFDDDGSEIGDVRVRNVLNRAGVAYLTSASSSTARYRFDPFWIHAHLIERRNLRIESQREYHTCE